jgi:hypothetical protein
MSIFYRQSNQFKIDDSKLSSKARNTQIKNALYAAVYQEFFGASENPNYKDLTLVQRMNKLNEFAENWLLKRGLK